MQPTIEEVKKIAFRHDMLLNESARCFTCDWAGERGQRGFMATVICDIDGTEMDYDDGPCECYKRTW